MWRTVKVSGAPREEDYGAMAFSHLQMNVMKRPTILLSGLYLLRMSRFRSWAPFKKSFATPLVKVLVYGE